MIPLKRWLTCLVASPLVACCALGCGGSSDPQPATGSVATSGDKSETAPSQGSSLPVASIGGTATKAAGGPDAMIGDDDEDEAKDPFNGEPEVETPVAEPSRGTPEFLIREAMKLRLQPPPKTEDVAQLRADRKERNEQIVSLMQEVIALTHEDKEKERLFNVAVHHLMDARLQLAFLGDREYVDELYEDAAALWDREPGSTAAAEGAYTLVNFAYRHAKNASSENTRWLQEFARQSQHYALNFPQEQRKALPLLFTAGRSCELHGLTDDARKCYELVLSKYPQSQYAPRVTGILRRLKLVGQPAQLAGPTIDGKHVTVDDLIGQVVLVVFWSTEAKPFASQLPLIVDAHQKFSRKGLSIVGVNLDKEPSTVNQFLVKNQLAWPQIFFPEAEQRGWNNPLASFYGVMNIPALWLIDRDGLVVSTNVDAKQLEQEIARLLLMKPNAPATP